MSRNTNSIGYIPPTPFRDDSDVFVLPNDPPAELEEVFPDETAPENDVDHRPAESSLEQEIEMIAGFRRELQLRHNEIAGHFRELMHSLPSVRQTGPEPKPSRLPQAEVQAVAAVPPPTTPRGAGPDPHDEVEYMNAPADPKREPGNDRLAALKAQLAVRLQSVQGGKRSSSGNTEVNK